MGDSLIPIVLLYVPPNYFADGCFRQVRPEVYTFRTLVSRQSILTVFDEFVSGDLKAVFQYNHSMHTLSPLFIWNRNDSAFPDCGMDVKNVFRFFWINILPAGYDHVCFPIL